MVRQLSAIGASRQGTPAFSAALSTAGLWILGCITAAASAAVKHVTDYFAPSVFADAFKHYPLGGWTPALASLLLTVIPGCIVALLSYKRMGAEIGRLAAGNDPTPKTVSRLHAALALLAWMAMYAVINLRFLGTYWSPPVKREVLLQFQLADMVFATLPWFTVVYMHIYAELRLWFTLGSYQHVAFGKLLHVLPLMGLRSLVILDTIKTLLIGVWPGQAAVPGLPVINGNFNAYTLAQAIAILSVAAYLELPEKNPLVAVGRIFVRVPGPDEEQAAPCGEASVDGQGDVGSSKANKIVV